MPQTRIRTPQWRFEILQPDGTKTALSGWKPTSITENFDGASIRLVVPASRPELAQVTDLVTDIIVYRGGEKAYTMRVLDSDDVINRRSHEVTLVCATYESVLAGRILYTDFEDTDDQHDLAWLLIDQAQDRQDMGLTRAADSGASGQNRTKTIGKGANVVEALNDLASAPNGFDWWIDQNLEVHFQTPRRAVVLDEDWRLGANVATVNRQSFADQYASSVLVLGALQEVSIPQSGGGFNVYPPPDPVIAELPTMPRGRWERTISYPDVVTNASLLEKARWNIHQAGIFRPTYRIEMEPGQWRTSARPGAIVSLRVKAPPRFNFRVLARIEELQIGITPSGEETITIALRAEEEEVQLGGTSSVTITASNTSPAGAITVTTPAPQGRSITTARVRPVNQLASMLSSFSQRLGRRERTL